VWLVHLSVQGRFAGVVLAAPAGTLAEELPTFMAISHHVPGGVGGVKADAAAASAAAAALPSQGDAAGHLLLPVSLATVSLAGFLSGTL
jgi:hypothetical protein